MPATYGIDPEILEYCTLTTRSGPTPGIGFGSPRVFPFKQGQPLDSTWTITTGSWSVAPNDGFLRFQGHGVTNDTAQAAITTPFSLGLANVTVAFQLRVNRVSLDHGSGGFLFDFAPGLVLDWGGDSANSVYGYVDDSDADFHQLAPSGIKPDGSWHRIVVNIHPELVTLWEDDQQVLTWVPTPRPGDSVQAYFRIRTSGASASLDVGDVSVLVGTNQRARLRMAASDQQAFRGRLSYLQSLAAYMPDLLTAAKPVTDALSAIRVGPTALFWGLDIPDALQRSVRSLPQQAAVTRLVSAAGVTSSIDRPPTFYLGISLSASFILSGGYSLGFLMGTGSNAYTLAVLTLNGGGVTNAGIQATVEACVMWQEPEVFLGFGAYVQADGGEFFQGSLGVSGNIPLHLNAFDNCGPALNAGAGVSILPLDIAGGISYTWKMARL